MRKREGECRGRKGQPERWKNMEGKGIRFCKRERHRRYKKESRERGDGKNLFLRRKSNEAKKQDLEKTGRKVEQRKITKGIEG